MNDTYVLGGQMDHTLTDLEQSLGLVHLTRHTSLLLNDPI